MPTCWKRVPAPLSLFGRVPLAFPQSLHLLRSLRGRAEQWPNYWSWAWHHRPSLPTPGAQASSPVGGAPKPAHRESPHDQPS